MEDSVHATIRAITQRRESKTIATDDHVSLPSCPSWRVEQGPRPPFGWSKSCESRENATGPACSYEAAEREKRRRTMCPRLFHGPPLFSTAREDPGVPSRRPHGISTTSARYQYPTRCRQFGLGYVSPEGTPTTRLLARAPRPSQPVQLMRRR